MRRHVAELAVTVAFLALAALDTPDRWRMLARGCQRTALAVGRVGIYAEDRAAVLASNAA
jgi:hypothetical protein